MFENVGENVQTILEMLARNYSFQKIIKQCLHLLCEVSIQTSGGCPSSLSLVSQETKQ